MKDEDIDTSDIPELTADFFKKAVLWPGTKKQITLRLDPDVIDFFKKKGRGYQTLINAVLRKYVEVHGFEPEKKTMHVAETPGVYRAGRAGSERAKAGRKRKS